MKIALVGNQNSGKTTLFNLLTGSSAKVGNWPGVTIERKEGKIKKTNLDLVDLPGIYSLSPYTSEENVSRDFVMNENPDVIINIIDSTSLERSLYLTTQLLELDTNVVIALNMTDILSKKGIEINDKELEKELGCSVVRISALKNTGIDKLISLLSNNSFIKNDHKKIFSKEIEELINKYSINSINSRFVTVKMIENDPIYQQYKTIEIKNEIAKIEQNYDIDIEQIIANQRYEYIDSIKGKVLKVGQVKESVSDKLDKIFLNRWLAIPIFLVIMALIYILAVGVVGSATVDFIDGTVIGGFKDLVANWLTNINASDWVISLVCDGIIAGVGAVLNFVPQLIILFICISLLETSGYMNRIAFMFDRLFRKFGLNGKSLIPFIVGSGCSVPGIMSARTIEDEGEKNITIFTTPFIPCSAKLPVMALFAGYFFANNSGLITFSFYVLAIILIIIGGLILKRFFKSNDSAFISELPEYKAPSISYVAKDVLDKTLSFIKRAGTIILACSVVIWFLASFGFKDGFGLVENVDDSILAFIGNLFGWFFYPIIGEWSWAASVSAIQSIVAKEQVISSMNIIAGLAEGNEDAAALFNSSVFNFFNGLSAYSYCVFILFSSPCFGAIGAMRRELGSFKKTLLAVAFQIGVAWVLGSAIFGIGSLIKLIF